MKGGQDHDTILVLIRKYEEIGYQDYFANIWRPPFPVIRPDHEKWTVYDLVLQWAYIDGWERAQKFSSNNNLLTD